MAIGSAQWSRFDDPILDLSILRIVSVGGVLFYTNDQTPEERALPTAAQFTSISGVVYIKTV